jgi:hypothetical protein
MEVVGCPSCTRTFDLNKFITTIQVDLSIDSVPGSASVSLAVPRHTIDDFYFDGNPVITPMMEVEIYAKGYYLLEGIPQYYPIFWGLVTEVTDSYSSGAHTVSIQCADILKWWELTVMNTNPALLAPQGQAGYSTFGNTFAGSNPFDIIYSLSLQSKGDVIVGSGTYVSAYQEQKQASTFAAAFGDMMLYWSQRFQNIRSNLVMYGVNGKAVRGDTIARAYSRNSKGGGNKPPANFVSTAVQNANGGPDAGQAGFDPTSPTVTAFRTQINNVTGVNLMQSEFQTKLELANAAKECIGYEFYMDVDGSIIFKPPFYNLDVLKNKPLSWIQDIDIINWDLSESESEVVTQIIMQGSLEGNKDYSLGEELTPYTTVTDYHLLRTYGWRSKTINSEFLGDPQLMFYYGLDQLDRVNSRRHHGSITIPCRPELRLGFPVYVAPKDQIWYVTGISHNIAFGSQATTTLTLTGKRTKFIAPTGITSLTLTNTPTTSAAKTTSAAGAPQQTSSPGGGAPAPSSIQQKAQLSFPYSSIELAASGKFNLSFNGHPAFYPAIDVNKETSNTNNAYEPIVLRHPKTGRILGYPNAVMVYARPYVPANTTQLTSAAGQKNPGTFAQSSASSATTITNRQNQGVANQQAQTDPTNFTRLKNQFATNRYTYGLTSAGRFVYAHDTSMVIGEMLSIASTKINVTTKSQNAAAEKIVLDPTTMIRPVSDERGFEVIGHYRYGRRVALSDGRLVISNASTNSPANIGLQSAMGGGLFEMLTAQSQSVTAISAAQTNPASTVANLAPGDLQTSAVPGVSQPDSTSPQYTGDGTNFIDSSTLGSPTQGGVSTNPEASQLSKALTLAELSIKENLEDPGDPNNTNCPCTLGRSDLAFINSGYAVAQTNPINATNPDNSSLSNTVPGGSITSTYGDSTTGPSGLQTQVTNLQAQVASLNTQLGNAQTNASQVSYQQNPTQWTAAQQSVTTIQNQLDAANEALASAQTQLASVQSTPNATSGQGTTAPSTSTLQGRVEAYLANLYNTLDKPHQQLEHALRGDLLPGGLLSSNPSDLYQGPNTAQPLSPPFSPSNRFVLGDASAQIGAAKTNETNLANNFSNFSNQLKAASQRAQLSATIQGDTAQLTALQQQIVKLQQQITNSSGSIYVGTETLAQQLQQAQQQAYQLQQQINAAQLQLQQLPPSPSAQGLNQTVTSTGGQ